MQPYDYSFLLGKIREKGETQVSIAKKVGISPVTLNQKLKNHREFTQNEMFSICKILDIADISKYFFSH